MGTAGAEMRVGGVRSMQHCSLRSAGHGGDGVDGRRACDTLAHLASTLLAPAADAHGHFLRVAKGCTCGIGLGV